MQTIHTIGYEGTHQEAFIHTLLAHDVQHLIDVRERPISRKRGFSKHVLKAALALHGISYTHIQSLGDPKAGREAARAGQIDSFRSIYLSHLATPQAQHGLSEAVAIAKTSRSALMCFERDPEVCHRLLVIHQMEALGLFTANHLAVPPEASSRRNEQQARAIEVG